MTLPSERWKARAACRGEDQALFFPAGDDGGLFVGAALAICAGCPVKESCLAYAIRTKSEGVWGGVPSREERDRIARRRRAAAARISA